MRCPYCGFLESKVIDSRRTEDEEGIRRRRECLDCNSRFTTYEKVEKVPLIVVKKNGGREVFDRTKILNCLIRACEKRPVSLAQLEELVDLVERQLRNTMDKEVSSRAIGEQVMEQLRGLDEVAYVRFASVYRQFSDVSNFLGELQQLMEQQNKKTGKRKKK